MDPRPFLPSQSQAFRTKGIPNFSSRRDMPAATLDARLVKSALLLLTTSIDRQRPFDLSFGFAKEWVQYGHVSQMQFGHGFLQQEK